MFMYIYTYFFGHCLLSDRNITETIYTNLVFRGRAAEAGFDPGSGAWRARRVFLVAGAGAAAGIEPGVRRPQAAPPPTRPQTQRRPGHNPKPFRHRDSSPGRSGEGRVS